MEEVLLRIGNMEIELEIKGGANTRQFLNVCDGLIDGMIIRNGLPADDGDIEMLYHGVVIGRRIRQDKYYGEWQKVDIGSQL